jgi:glycyl-tRNA synthetase beta chain
MIDSEVVDAEIFGLRSANRTFGHRFHAPGALEIPAAADYESLLLSQGLVIASFEKRRDAIRHMVEQEAARLGGMAHIEDALLDEVTALVEYPVAVCGQRTRSILRCSTAMAPCYRILSPLPISIAAGPRWWRAETSA